MTDTYHSLTVVLENNIRHDDAKNLIDAIGMLKGVIKVSGEVSDVHSNMAYTRAKQELIDSLYKVLK